MLFTHHLLAQENMGRIYGSVTTHHAKPVDGATVVIKGLNKVAVTEVDGSYELKAIPFGVYEVEISALEIVFKTEIISLNSKEQLFNINTIAKESRKLKEIHIRGKTEKRKIETSGFAVNVIDTREAANRNIQTNELLDQTVGVRVRQSGGIGSAVDYNLNGMSGRAVGVFIDGLEISTYGASFNLNNIPPALIERIEVYKGVLPAHLSGDLLGGAINIVLKKGTAVNNITTSVSYGSFNTFQTDINANYRNTKNGFTANLSGFHTATDNNYEQWGRFSKFISPDGRVTRNFRTRRFFDGFNTTGARLEAGFTQVKWADVLLLSYNFSDAYKEIQHGQTMGTPYMGRTSETQAHILGVNYKKSNLIFKGLDFNLNAAYSARSTYIQDTIPWAYNWDGNIRTDLNGNKIRRLEGAQQGAPMIDEITRNITNARANLSYELFKNHRLSINDIFYAVSRRDEDLLNPQVNNGLKSSVDFAKNVISFNYEAESFLNKLTSNVFAKIYQQFVGSTSYLVNNGVLTQNVLEDNRTETGYGLAISYKILPSVSLITSAERAIRMPDDDEVFGSPDRNIIANRQLRPELSDNYNLGFRLGMLNFKKHKISLYSNVFGRNVKDRIMAQANELLNNQEIEETQFVNISSAQSIGFEGELSYAYDKKLGMIVNFSKFNSLLKQRGSRYYNTQIPNEPFFTINANIHYNISNVFQEASHLNLFYSFGYVAPFKTVWPESQDFITPTQYAQNVGLSYRFPDRKVIASLDLKNILNAEIYDNFGVQKPGRAIYLKLNYTINKF